VKPTGWVVDMRHHLDEETGDSGGAHPERVGEFAGGGHADSSPPLSWTLWIRRSDSSFSAHVAELTRERLDT
jgi:hypothetical protein